MNTDRSRSGRSSRSAVGPRKRTSPFSRNTARSASVRATLTDCSTSTIVVPAAWMVADHVEELADDRRGQAEGQLVDEEHRGLVTKARASDSICCSPPERFPAGWASRSARTGNRSSTSSRAASIAASVLPERPGGEPQVLVDGERGEEPCPPGMSETPARVRPRRRRR